MEIDRSVINQIHSARTSIFQKWKKNTLLGLPDPGRGEKPDREALVSRQLLQKFRDIGSPQRALRQILVTQGLLSCLNQHVTSILYPRHLAFHDLELRRIEQIILQSLLRGISS